ncbi:MAG: LLM class F420-dependent oxidoreductase [Myxococcota bacterium]
MELGVVFPQTEIGNDPLAIRDFAQAVEELGFTHLLLYEHVLGADPDRPGGWRGPYDKDTPFHELFVTMGYLAAVTTRLELTSGVLILPQRQTVLVAKQAAEVDILSGGRLRLGIGTGWNAVEYEALGENFHDRGRRQEEQVALIRELWAKDSLSFEGRWHQVTRASINPRPAHQIPIWFGGMVDTVLERAARLGDGWMPLLGPEQSKPSLEKLRSHLEENGRDASSFGIEAQAQIARGTPERWVKHAEAWQKLGATHLALATMNAGLATPQDHIDAVARYRREVA